MECLRIGVDGELGEMLAYEPLAGHRIAAPDAVYAGMRPLGPADIAEAVAWASSLPAHVNINVIELMPVAQSFAAFQVHRS